MHPVMGTPTSNKFRSYISVGVEIVYRNPASKTNLDHHELKLAGLYQWFILSILTATFH